MADSMDERRKVLSRIAGGPGLAPSAPGEIDTGHVHGHFIDGGVVAAQSKAHLDEFNPRTGLPSFRIARGSAQDVAAAVSAASDALPAWRTLKPIERGRVLSRVAALIRELRDHFAHLESEESGKPLATASAEVEIAAQYFELFGGLAASLQGTIIAAGPSHHVYTVREPYGVVGIILPWNSPLNQAARGIAPALAAGNVIVAKPSEFTSVSLLRLVALATERVGLPAGVVNVVTGTGLEAGAPLVAHPQVRKLVFTGSLRAGKEIGRIAAERILPLTLELGGKSPNIVFEDADFDRAVAGAVAAFTVNSGQVCIAGSRCLVQASIFDRFVAALVEKVKGLRLEIDAPGGLGPMTTRDQYDKVCGFYQIARDEGAHALVGGVLPQAAGGGWYVAPTVYVGVTNDMRIAREECFGPVLAVMPFDTEDEAITIANDTVYGLTAGVWTRDLSRAHRMAAAIEAGQVFVNEYPGGSVETPFGGYKQSGYGREKGLEALHTYTQLKSVIMKLA